MSSTRVATKPQQLQLLADCLHKGLHALSVDLIYRYPYGRWTCADGRQVLFNRGYNPIWSWRPNRGVDAL